MTRSRTDELLTILQQYFNPREEGWLWLATYHDDRADGVVEQFEGHYEDAAATAQGLARMITDSGADFAYLALCRREGRPTEADRAMWRELRRIESATSLTDMVVFNRRQIWSMRAEDAAAAC
jgi:hypothetical protein